MHRCWAKDPVIRPSFRDIITQLEISRARTILEYPSEVSFWLSYWPTMSKIPYPQFVKLLLHDIKLNKEDLAFMLQTKENGDVSQSGYKMLLDWFGPLHEDANLMQMVLIMEAKWFGPRLNADEAAGILGRDQVPGTFLVRLNQGKSNPIPSNPFTISFFIGDTTRHLRIIRTYLGKSPEAFYELDFSVNDQKYYYQHSTLTGLIDTLTENLPLYFSSPPESLQPPVY